MTKRSTDQINVDEILAGWGIDGLIAQRFLGWTKGSPITGGTSTPYAFWWHPPEGAAQTLPPKLSEDMNLTWEVIEALFKLGWKFGMTQNSNKEVVIAFVPIREGYEPTDAIKVRVPSVRLAPLAVCRAALLVSATILEAEQEDESKLQVM